ncbi:MAG: UDP-N-acetylmuramate--L-alanine ligase [Patescibacteria group bacterium]
MKNVHDWKKVHLIGIGGINMSAVAKILLKAGIKVSGSDVKETDITKEAAALGVAVAIGPQNAANIPVDCDGVIHTSAAPDSNPERVEAKNRNLPDTDNFKWMGEWFKSKKVVLVTGTHGKSTTTALLGQMAIAGGLDPTVIVGSRVPGWADHNLRFGQSGLVIIEGDEYARHFLEFHPEALIINNIELDHVDIYKNIDEVRKTFEKLLRQVKINGTVIANGEYDQILTAVKPLSATKKLNVQYFARQNKVVPELRTPDSVHVVVIAWKDDKLHVSIKSAKSDLKLTSSLIGDYNGMNIAAAALMAKHLGVADSAIAEAAGDFPGIWRRMELIDEVKGVPVFSDYGHHPSAVTNVISAVREAYPDKRIVLCFQPHHKNRTKNLWQEFVACFDRADVLVLCEIYDVAGRAAPEDANITSQKLLDEVRARAVARPLDITEYAPDPESAVKRTLNIIKEGDICIFMGAGDIDSALRDRMK